MGSLAVVSRIIRCSGIAAGVGAMLLAVGAMGQQLGKQPTVTPTGNWPVSVVAGDGPIPDGIADIVYCDPPVAGVSVGCHLWRGDGKGDFALVEDYAGTVPGSQYTATFANFSATLHQIVTLSVHVDNPHEVDLLVQSGQGTYEGSTFAMQGSKNVVPGPIQYFVYNAANDPLGDTNRGYLVEDLANGYVYSTNDLGQPLFTMQPSGGAGQLIVGDFNGDGITDFLVLGSASNAVTEYLGVGDGSFVAGTQYSLPGGIFSMLVGDIDGDGLADLVVEGTNGALSAFLGEAGVGPSKQVAITTAPNGPNGYGGHLVGIADLNGDGFADIVTSTPTGIYVLLGGGAVPYIAPYNAGPGRTSYALADFNGDGHLDLAVDSPEGIAILYGDGQGGFDTGQTIEVGQPAYSLALGQFSTGGSNLGIAVATGVPQVVVFGGDGTGNFSAVPFGPSSAGDAGADAGRRVSAPSLPVPVPADGAKTNAGRTVWSHVVVGDFNRDGHDDAVVALDGPIGVDLGPCCTYPASDDGLSVLYGGGSSGLEAPQAIWPVANDPKYGEVAESDYLFGETIPGLMIFGLGNVEAYIGSSDDFAGNGPVYNFSSYADGHQHPYAQFALGQFAKARVVGPDMVQQFPSSTGANFFTAANYGGGNFTTDPITLAVPAGYVAPDLPTSTLPATGMYVSAMALQDLDGDGFGDLEVIYHNLAADPAHPSPSTQNLLYIYWGKGVGATGDGTFDPTPTILTLSRNYYEMAVGDVNGDGFPDLVLSDGYLISVLAGNGFRSGFTQETHYLAGMGINQVVVQDVNGDFKPDIVVANGGAVLTAGVVNRGVLASNAEVDSGGVTVLANAASASATVSGTVTATPNPVPFGTDITFTANLTGSEQTAPTGTVVFYAGSTEIGSQTLTGGSASYVYLYNPGVPPIINAGTYTVTAQYSGDSVYAATTLTGATPLVVQPVATTTTLIDVLPTIFYGQIIADTGVEETSPEPDGGTLDFLIDGVESCSLTLTPAGGEQYCPPSTGAGYDAGTYMVQSVYSGDQNYLTSSSPVYTVVVQPDPTSATLTASTGTSSTVGQAVTLTAAIADAYATARGTVNFFDGTTQIGTGTVNGAGQATYTTSALALGAHSLSACLVASLDFLASNPCGMLSFTVNPVVTPPPPPTGTFTLAVNPASLSIGVGNSVVAQVVVTALNGYSQPVQLTCSGLPQETTCTFVQSLIGAGGGSTGMIVSPAAPHACGSSTPDFVAPNAQTVLAGLALSALALLGLRRRRKLVRSVALMMLLAGGLTAVSGLGGCGGKCLDLGTQPNNYTFTVTGTSTGSPATSQTVTVKMDAHL